MAAERDHFVAPLCVVLGFASALFSGFGFNAVLDNVFPTLFFALSCADGMGYAVRERVFFVVERVTTGMARGVIVIELSKLDTRGKDVGKGCKGKRDGGGQVARGIDLGRLLMFESGVQLHTAQGKGTGLGSYQR